MSVIPLLFCSFKKLKTFTKKNLAAGAPEINHEKKSVKLLSKFSCNFEGFFCNIIFLNKIANFFLTLYVEY